MMRSEAELGQPFAKMFCLALGLLFLGKQDAVDATLEVPPPPTPLTPFAPLPQLH